MRYQVIILTDPELEEIRQTYIKSKPPNADWTPLGRSLLRKLGEPKKSDSASAKAGALALTAGEKFFEG